MKIKKYGLKRVEIEAEYSCKTWKAQIMRFFYTLKLMRFVKVRVVAKSEGMENEIDCFYRLVIPRFKLEKTEEMPGELINID